MSTIRQVKFERAKSYVLAHPDETKEQQSLGCGVSVSMIALARAQLIKDGRLTPTRKLPRATAPDPTVPPSDRSPDEGSGQQPSKPAGMLDHEAMKAMSDMLAGLDDLDDEEIHRRLLKQCIRFAFDPKLHPDTRMSASQMWAKLRDQAKTRDLGPGPPLTLEDATERMRDLMVAAGPTITLAAVNAAFDVKETSDGQAADDQAAPAGGTPPAPGPA